MAAMVRTPVRARRIRSQVTESPSHIETETRAELIDPALKEAGWGVLDGSRVLRERNCQITLGRLQGAGQRSKPEIADYILVYRNRKLAVIEAKKRDLPVTQGVGQAKQYAGKLQVRYTYSTNGLGIYQIDMETGAEGAVDAFPSPKNLWQMTFAEENAWRNRFAAVPFEDVASTTTSTLGPSGGSRVMCLTCHRAHASSSPAAGRWDFRVGLLSQDGLVSGSFPIPDPFNSLNQGPLCSKCHLGGAPD